MSKASSAAPAVFTIVGVVCLQAVGASLAAQQQSAGGFILVWTVSSLLLALCLVFLWYTLRVVLVLNTRLKRIEEKLGLTSPRKGEAAPESADVPAGGE